MSIRNLRDPRILSIFVGLALGYNFPRLRLKTQYLSFSTFSSVPKRGQPSIGRLREYNAAMKAKSNVAIIGTPRSASSFLAKLIVMRGWQVPHYGDLTTMSASQFNPEGYFESTYLNLLNDQIIRSRFGNAHSFLYPPKISNSDAEFLDQGFFFDLDEAHVDCPKDYLSNLKAYTGVDWDVWGLSRMVEGEKWHKAYSVRKISSFEQVTQAISDFNAYLSSTHSLVIKDSRLTFTLDLFAKGIDKVIILQREESGLSSSIRNHYGKNIFTKNTVKDFSWVSNHFNYKVGPMSFGDFSQRYEDFYSDIEKSCSVLRVNQHKLSEESTIREIIEFVEN